MCISYHLLIFATQLIEVTDPPHYSSPALEIIITWFESDPFVRGISFPENGLGGKDFDL